MKYDVRGAREAALQRLVQPRFLDAEPLRIYAIACRLRAEKEAHLAAKYMLRHPLMRDGYVVELDAIDAGLLYRLQRYHKRCTEAASEVARDHTWIRTGAYTFLGCENDPDEQTTTISTHPSRKYKKGHHINVDTHRWWLDFMKSMEVALSSAVSIDTIIDHARVAAVAVAASKCAPCRAEIAEDLPAFIAAFTKEVEERISKVKHLTPTK
jgi:hypothetical protein